MSAVFICGNLHTNYMHPDLVGEANKAGCSCSVWDGSQLVLSAKGHKGQYNIQSCSPN